MRSLVRLLFLTMIISVICLSGCHRSHSNPDELSAIDSLYSAKSYLQCLHQILNDDDNNGYLYHIAFYKAIDSDSLLSYSRFLDSVWNSGNHHEADHYIASLRLLSRYLLSSNDYDSLKKEVQSMRPCPDLNQEEIFAHNIAKSMVGSDAPMAMNMQIRAVQAMRHGGRYRPSEILSQAALICSNLGNYQTAMDYLNEAADTLSAHGWPSRETVFMLGNKASLYRSLQMHDSALNVNSQALRIAADNPSLTADLLTARAQMFAEAEMGDSAYASLDAAELVLSRNNLPYGPMFLRHIRSRKGILTSTDANASVAQLKKAASDLESSFSDRSELWEEKFAYGQILYRLGDPDGLRIMRDAHDSIARFLEPRTLLWAKRNLVDAYSHLGMTAEATREYNDAFALVDTINAQQTRYLAIAKEIEYRIRQHERENSLLKQTHRQDQSKVMWLTVVAVLSVILLILAGVFIVLNRRLLHKKRVVDSHQIMMLVENQKTHNRCIEELQNESEEEGFDWAALTPSSMSVKDTALFRKSFISLYPDFLKKLHEICPDITTNDENLCMLIKIGQTSDDIALALGISKPSVNSARYRIRKKMGLNKETSLNDVIYNL